MASNNRQTLTEKELNYLNEKYEFSIADDNVLVSVKNYDRTTAHKIDTGFSLNTDVKKIFISSDAIKFWQNSFSKDYTLLDVQNAINTLIVLYQNVSLEDVKKQLETKTNEIKVV